MEILNSFLHAIMSQRISKIEQQQKKGKVIPFVWYCVWIEAILANNWYIFTCYVLFVPSLFMNGKKKWHKNAMVSMCVAF